MQDLAGKVSLLGKSASRHIDNLKHHVSRECQVSKDDEQSSNHIFWGAGSNVLLSLFSMD